MRTLSQPHFRSAEKARAYLETLRWPFGPVCPHCGAIGEHHPLEGLADEGSWACNRCGRNFTVAVGTIFEDSRVPLNVWLRAVYLLCCYERRISRPRLQRTLGVPPRTVMSMTRRIRAAAREGAPGDD